MPREADVESKAREQGAYTLSRPGLKQVRNAVREDHAPAYASPASRASGAAVVVKMLPRLDVLFGGVCSRGSRRGRAIKDTHRSRSSGRSARRPFSTGSARPDTKALASVWTERTRPMRVIDAIRLQPERRLAISAESSAGKHRHSWPCNSVGDADRGMPALRQAQHERTVVIRCPPTSPSSPAPPRTAASPPPAAAPRPAPARRGARARP